MERRAFLIFTGTLAAATLAGCAGQAALPSADTSGMRFSEADRKAIMGYYEQQGARKPGREKPAQRVKPGDKLDPGQRPNHLPSDLDRLLSTLPDPYARLTLGADVILVNRTSHDIVDVIAQIAY